MVESFFNVNICPWDDSWVFVTVASHHFCWDKTLFSEFRPFNNEKMTVAVDDVTFPIEGCRKNDTVF